MALSEKVIQALALSDTRKVADTLIHGSLIGTEVGDAVIAEIGNYPERYSALVATLTRRTAWESSL